MRTGNIFGSTPDNNAMSRKGVSMSRAIMIAHFRLFFELSAGKD